MSGSWEHGAGQGRGAGGRCGSQRGTGATLVGTPHVDPRTSLGAQKAENQGRLGSSVG